MDISPLPIKLIRQDPSSNDCLRCCGLMILNFFKDKINEEEMWRKLHVYKRHSGLYGGYLSDLGTLASMRNCKTTIFHYDWHRWDKHTAEASQKGKKKLLKALGNLKKRKKTWPDKKVVAKEIRYLKSGGKYKFAIPKLATIDTHLTQGLPPILAVRSEELYHDPEDNYTHFIVVSGKKGNNYLIKDPYLAIEEVPADELLYAWSRTGGWMMAISPPPTKKAQLPLFEQR